MKGFIALTLFLLLLPALFTAVHSKVIANEANSRTETIVLQTEASYYAASDLRHGISQAIERASALNSTPESPGFQMLFTSEAILLQNSITRGYKKDDFEISLWCGNLMSKEELQDLAYSAKKDKKAAKCPGCWGLLDIVPYSCVKGKAIRTEFLNPCTMMLSSDSGELRIASFRRTYSTASGEICTLVGAGTFGPDSALGATIYDKKTGEIQIAALYSGAVIGVG